MSERKRLWVSDAPRRFFLVPIDVELPEGELSIRCLEARSRSVDEGAAAGWEVDLEEAKVRDAWRELIGAPPTDAPPDLGVLGRTPADVVLDPELAKLSAAVRQGARQLGAELDARAPEVQKTVEDVGHEVVDLGRKALDGLRGLARRATIRAEDE